MGKKANIKRLPEQPGDVHRTYADIHKAGRSLDYKPKYPLSKASACSWRGTKGAKNKRAILFLKK